MILPDDERLYGPAVYNPDLLSKEELIRYFVARRPLLERILDDLRRHGPGGSSQHRLIVGARGMGKTTLLRRLAYAIADDPELNGSWLPLIFPEEQYNIARLSDLWLNCLDALGDTLERLGRRHAADEVDDLVDEVEVEDDREAARRALALLLGRAETMGRRLVLLIDNLDLVLGRLKEQHWTIRRLLAEEPRLLIVGASAGAIESTYEYDGAFYDFFKIDELKGLSVEEMRSVLDNLAVEGRTPQVTRLLDQNPGRLRVLHNLTGGNPRTTVLLHGVLARGIEGNVRSDLEGLLDQCTPLYKARFEDLSTQAQQLVDTLAIHWDPMSAAQVAARTRIPLNNVSSQLNRLEREGVVEKVPFHPGKKIGFQVAERFFNIWYLMRASRRIRRKLVWLVKFLGMMYSQEELQGEAVRHLRGAAEGDVKRVEYGFALAHAVEDRPLRRALEHASLGRLISERHWRDELDSLLDLDGEDAELKDPAERMQRLAEIRESIERAEVAWPDGEGARGFWELLAENAGLSLAEKAHVAKGLVRHTPEELRGLFRYLRGGRRRLEQGLGDLVLAERVREAVRSGQMKDLADTEGADAVARRYGVEKLSLVARVVAFGNAPAEEQLEEVRRLVERLNLPVVWLSLGRAERKLKHYKAAEWAFQRVIDVCPSYAPAYASLGWTYMYCLPDYPLAERCYRKAVEVQEEFLPAWTDLGILLAEWKGDLEEARTCMLRAQNLFPDSPAAWNAYGILSNQMGDRAAAEQAYRRVVAIDEGWAVGWSNLGDALFYGHGDLEEAEAVIRKAVALQPDDSMYRGNLAMILAHRDRWPEAKEQMAWLLANGEEGYFAWCWKDILMFFQGAIRNGHAGEALELLASSSQGERWRPLVEALRTVVHGNRDYLRSVAPEIRNPAAEILAQIAPEFDPLPRR